MLVMCANQTGIEFGRLCGMFPGSLGHLLSPGGKAGPFPWLPYALDNGAFGAYTHNRPFDETAFFKLCDWAKGTGIPPRWVIVPDVVADPVKTLHQWDAYFERVKIYGWPLAFAAQDGHVPSDVPNNADLVFIGGTTKWKYQSIKPFCHQHSRVHVGRINGYLWLKNCFRLGVESVDGTGFFRGDRVQLEGLISFLEEQHEVNRHPVQKRMFASV